MYNHSVCGSHVKKFVASVTWGQIQPERQMSRERLGLLKRFPAPRAPTLPTPRPPCAQVCAGKPRAGVRALTGQLAPRPHCSHPSGNVSASPSLSPCASRPGSGSFQGSHNAGTGGFTPLFLMFSLPPRATLP